MLGSFAAKWEKIGFIALGGMFGISLGSLLYTAIMSRIEALQ